jgi:hypothetical protein
MSRRRKPLTPGDPRHGTPAGYSAGCNEDCCREAFNTYRRELRNPRGREEKPDLSRMRLHKADDLGQGFLRRCSCGHTPGEHGLVKLGQPQPCDSPGCECKDLDKPPVPEIRYHEGIQGPLGKRLA